MGAPLDILKLMRGVGFFIWASLGALVPLNGLTNRVGINSLEPLDLKVWLAAYLAFGAALWLWFAGGEGSRAARRRSWLTAFMVVAALVVNALFDQAADFGSLLIITAALIGAQLPWRPAAVTCALQSVAFFLVLTLVRPDREAPYLALSFALHQVFAFFAAHIATREARARRELAEANGELRATRRLLADSSRAAERVRIARELHDTMGHHLTVLSLNLEVAGHRMRPGEPLDPEALEQVRRARGLAKLLLADVRGTVGAMRSGGLDFRGALTALTEEVPSPVVHLDLPDALELEDPGRAHVLLRCAQEIVTNAVRHAEAKNLWLAVERTPEELTLRARDDGRGPGAARAGHGLRGMRERLEELGGRLEFGPLPGGGFAVDARLPLGSPA